MKTTADREAEQLWKGLKTHFALKVMERGIALIFFFQVPLSTCQILGLLRPLICWHSVLYTLVNRKLQYRLSKAEWGVLQKAARARDLEQSWRHGKQHGVALSKGSARGPVALWQMYTQCQCTYYIGYIGFYYCFFFFTRTHWEIKACESPLATRGIIAFRGLL